MAPESIPAATSLSATTEQPAQLPESIPQEAIIPQAFWTVVILSLVLFVLLLWKAIDEMADSIRKGDR
jgi:hypothetical protein